MSGQDVDHDRLRLDKITIKEPGYVYIYLSNLNSTEVEVYFDDFIVEHIKTPVIQTEDYYPFGFTFNSYLRENTLYNRYQPNKKEILDDLSLALVDYGARIYMSDIGRWSTIDPSASKYFEWPPFSYTVNNPINFIDPDGERLLQKRMNEGRMELNILIRKLP